MPHCTLALTFEDGEHECGAERFPAIDIDSFHPCVDQARFSADRNIQFIPPDGEFELLRFHPSRPPSSPLVLHPPVVIVDVRVHSSTASTVTLSLSACLQRADGWPASADEAQIRIPVPVGLQAGVFKQPLLQRSALELEEQAIVWTISRPRPDKQYTAQASFQRVAGAEQAGGAGDELPAIKTVVDSRRASVTLLPHAGGTGRMDGDHRWPRSSCDKLTALGSTLCRSRVHAAASSGISAARLAPLYMRPVCIPANLPCVGGRCR